MAWHLFPTKRPKISLTTIDLLVLFGLMVLFYGNPLLHPMYASYSGDAFSLFLPALDLYRDSMYQGILPLWNPLTRMGTPFLASYQGAVLYPPQLIALLFKSPVQALNLGAFLSIVWFSFGAYLFGVRALKLARFPSLLMGVALGASGFVGGHMDHVNQLAAICWIPWILTETLLLLRRPRLQHVVVLAVLVGFQIMAGHPQYVVYTFIYLVALDAIFFVYFVHRRRIDDPPAWLGMVLLIAALGAGLGLGAAQIMPAAEMSAKSIRQLDAELFPDRMYSFSYPPEHLLTTVWPYAFGNPATGLHDIRGNPLEGEEVYNFGEYVSYVGLITVILALVAVVTLFREFVVRCFLFLALLSLLMAFGKNVPPFAVPPYRLLTLGLPTVEHMRVPARFLVFFNISLVVLAAVGFNQLIFFLKVRQRGPATAITPLCFLILVVVLFDLYWFSRFQAFRHRGSVDILEERGPAVELLASPSEEWRLFRLMFEVPYDSDGYRLRRRQSIKKMTTRQQVQRLQANINMLFDVPICQGYEEGLQPTLDNYRFLSAQCRRNVFTPYPDTRLLGLMNVRYLMTDKPVFSDRLKPIQTARYTVLRPGDPMLYDDSLPMRAWSNDQADALWRHAIFENLDFVPRFTWASDLRAHYDLEALDADPDKAPFDPASGRQLPFLGYRRSSDTQTPEVSAEQTRDERKISFYRPSSSPNAYVVKKSERVKGELVLLESPWPGWVCRWNGEKHPMKRVNAIMMSCEAPVGPAEVEVAFEPYSFRLGLFISCCFVMGLSALAFFYDYPHDQPDPLRRRLKRMRRGKESHARKPA